MGQWFSDVSMHQTSPKGLVKLDAWDGVSDSGGLGCGLGICDSGQVSRLMNFRAPEMG